MSGWRTTVTMECDDCQEVVYQTLANEQTTVIGTRNRITLPDQMVRHECAPVVPVGVQPEPAEPSEWADPQLERQMKAAWKEADRHRAQPAGPGIPAHCGVCFTAWPCEVAQDRPAVSVVHPEPGDRAELMPEGVADFQLADALFPLLLLWLDEDDETVDEYAITRAAINHLRQRLPAEFALLFPSQVAAAVAAVRADRDRLAGQVAAIRALCDEEEASEASDAPTVRATVFGFNMTPDEATAFEDRLAEAAHNHDQEAFCVFDRGAHISARLTTAAIRAALVASSPTTPEAKK